MRSGKFSRGVAIDAGLGVVDEGCVGVDVGIEVDVDVDVDGVWGMVGVVALRVRRIEKSPGGVGSMPWSRRDLRVLCDSSWTLPGSSSISSSSTRMRIASTGSEGDGMVSKPIERDSVSRR